MVSPVMTAVEDLKVGDAVDLENDPYADPYTRIDQTGRQHFREGDEIRHMYLECELAAVAAEPEINPEDEILPGVRVEFDCTTTYFPRGHQVRVFQA
jgi:hypothetical protein